jgi:hypothetical protein
MKWAWTTDHDARLYSRARRRLSAKVEANMKQINARLGVMAGETDDQIRAFAKKPVVSDYYPLLEISPAAEAISREVIEKSPTRRSQGHGKNLSKANQQ